MATNKELVEIQWADLITRRAQGILTPYRVDYAWISIHSKERTLGVSDEQDLYGFVVPNFYFSLASRWNPRVSLHIKVQDGTDHWSFQTFRLVWKPHITSTKNGRVWSYFYNPEDLEFVLVPIHYKPFVPVSPWVILPKKAGEDIKAVVRTKQGDPTPLPPVIGVMARSHAYVNSRVARGIYGKSRNSKTSARPNPQSVVKTVPSMAWQWSSGGSLASFSQANNQIERWFRQISSVNTPNFRFLRKSQLPLNAFSATIRRTTSGNRFHSVDGLDSTFSLASWLFIKDSAILTGPLFPSTTPAHSALARNKAIGNLHEKVDGDTSNIPEDLAQYHQTVDMIGESVKKVFKGFIQVKSGNFAGASNTFFGVKKRPKFRPGVNPKKFSRHKDALAENWLEFQFGWKPALASIHSLLEGYAKYLAETDHLYTVSAAGRVVSHSSSDIRYTDNGDISLNTTSNPIIGTRRDKVLDVCRIGIWYDLGDKKRGFLSQLGFTNPVSLAWELVPFSFVFDYLLPVGNYLEALNYFDGYHFLEGWQTQFTRRESQLTLAHDSTFGPGERWKVRIFGDANRETVSVDRTILNGWPHTTFPEFRNPFTKTRTINLIALFQTFKG